MAGAVRRGAAYGSGQARGTGDEMNLKTVWGFE
jgi:hypothetical protein